MISVLADIKRNLDIALKEVAQLKLVLVNKQNKNLDKDKTINLTTLSTISFTKMNGIVQRSAKLPDTPKYREDYDGLEP